MNAPAQPRLWDQDDLAHFTGLSLDQIKKLRTSGDGPPYFKLGRQIRYSPAKVSAWLQTKEQESTK